MPEITVLLPVYNGMPYLPEAVESVLGQTLKDFKLLIIDDGSKDGSADYLDSIKDPRLEVVHQQNRGLGATLNRGIEMCKTEFLARMDADDISLPQRLEKQITFLKGHPDVGAVGTQVTNFVDTCVQSAFETPLALEHEKIYEALLKEEHSLCHPSLMFRTSAIKKIGGYRVEGIGEDWDMFLRLGEVAGLANLNEALYMYRIHTQSVTWSKVHECKERIAHAVHCAGCRMVGEKETGFDEFVSNYRSRPLLLRANERIDTYAFVQYRLAMIDMLEGRKMKGKARMVWAAFCSPARTFGRIKRELNRYKNSRHKRISK